MRTFSRCALLITALTCLTGCFSIKNTDGLALAYEDIDRASSKASELKTLANISDLQRNQAADLYREAKASINSYLQKSITDAADYTVDQPAESYTATGASAKVNAFVKRVGDLRGVAPDSVIWVPLAAAAINEIVKLHNQAQEAAYKRFVDTVNKYMMKNYEEIPSGAPNR